MMSNNGPICEPDYEPDSCGRRFVAVNVEDFSKKKWFAYICTDAVIGVRWKGTLRLL